MTIMEEQSDAIDVSDAQDGGVIKVIKKEGHGSTTPNEGASVYVHYVGTLLDGTKFDSSRDRGKPLDFILGRGIVIPGWELCIETMKKGEICSLTIKPEYAYGKQGRPPTIPADATLIFELELLYWIDEEVTIDSMVSKTILKKGKGSERVGDGGEVVGQMEVSVHLIGKVEDRIFDDRHVKFIIGEGDECNVIPAVDEAVKKMKKGEVALVTADPSYAFGENGKPEWGIAPNTPVSYQVRLKSFEQLKAPWELTSDERIENAKISKESGTKYFKEEKYSLALSKFSRLVSLVEGLSRKEDLDQVAPMILAGHLNVALCYLKLGKYMDCISSCDKALYRDPDNIKALYRKGRAKLFLHYLEEAFKLFQTVLKLDPRNKDARANYLVAKKQLDEYNAREKKVYAKMFDRFADRDSKMAARAQLEKANECKDVFARAEEEAKNTYGADPAPDSVSGEPTATRKKTAKVDQGQESDQKKPDDSPGNAPSTETSQKATDNSTAVETNGETIGSG